MDKLDFDYWKNLYKDDPDEFERKRTEAIEQEINSAPVHLQSRLRHLQSKLNSIHDAANPISATVQMMGMLFDKQQELVNLVSTVKVLTED